MIKCNNCSFEIENDNANFCPNCGNKIEKGSEENIEVKNVTYVKCNECGEETDANLDYCESCGVKLKGDEEQIVKAVPIVKRDFEIKKQNVNDYKNSSLRNQNKNQKSKKENYKKEPVKYSTPKEKGQQLSGTQIGIIIFGIAVLGFIVLFASGVFDDAPANTNQTTQNPAAQSNINLNDLQAINTLEATVSNDTTNLANVLELAHLLNDAGFKQRSLKYYEMYLRANPNVADVLVDLGVVHFDLRNYDLAKMYMKRGLRVEPKHQIAHLNLGVVNFTTGDADSAAIWWRKAVDLNPNNQIGMRAKELLEKNLNGGN